MKSRPVFLHALKLRQQAAIAPRPAVLRQIAFRPISTSPRLLNEQKSSQEGQQQQQDGQSQKSQKEQEKEKARKKRAEEEEMNAPPQSPFKVFAQVLKEEISKNKAWQDNVKQLQGDVDKVVDSAAMKRAREVYERARITNMIKNNPRIQSAVEDLRKKGLSVSDAINQSLQDSAVLQAIGASYGWATSAAFRATQPIRDTPVYQAIATSFEEAFDDDTGIGSRYGGYEEKEARRKRREKRAEKAGRTATKRTAPNPEAGESLVLSDKQQSTGSTRFAFIKNSPAYQRWLETFEESDSPFISALRTITTKVGGLFEENETAQVIRAMKEIDPDFRLERWTGELREYIVPEVVDAYLSADRESLRQWCGEATFNVLWATMGQYIKQGLISDSKILDIKHVDINSGKMLDNNVPVFLVTFATQELLLYRNAKTGEAVVGSEDAVDSCRYAIVLTRVDTELENPLTGGWKVVEMARRGTKSFV